MGLPAGGDLARVKRMAGVHGRVSAINGVRARRRLLADISFCALDARLGDGPSGAAW